MNPLALLLVIGLVMALFLLFTWEIWTARATFQAGRVQTFARRTWAAICYLPRALAKELEWLCLWFSMRCGLVMFANHTGSEGIVKVGTSAVAEVRGFEFTEQNDIIEDTTLTDTSKTFRPGVKGWSGSVSCWWDETDTTGQEAMTNGAEVTLNLYPEGATTGDIYFYGSAIIANIQRGNPMNGIVNADFQFTGNGALTRGTAA